MKAFPSLVHSLHKQNSKQQTVNVKLSTVNGLCGPLGLQLVVWEQEQETLKVICKNTLLQPFFSAYTERGICIMVLKFKTVHHVLGLFDDMENCLRVEKYVKIIVL